MKKTINEMISKRLSDSKSRAKSKNIEHNIDRDFIRILLKQSRGRCPVLGKKFVFEAKNPLNMSIDRIDNSLGYTRDNVWIVSTWANRAKNTLSEEVFKEYCKCVAEI